MSKTAIFPGSFDPPTLAHLNLIHRAMKVCDHLIVCIGENLNKKSMFTSKEREQLLKTLCPKVEVVIHLGLIVDLLKEKKAQFLIRGIRAEQDFDFEFQMSSANAHLAGVETLFLMADPKYIHISSQMVREIGHFGGSLKGFVPEEIEGMVRERARGGW